MTRPRLLDLCCYDGGAAMGYHRAGFEVVGVDIEPRPNYPFEFHQADAVEFLKLHGHEFDAGHASPPCQNKSAPTLGTNAARNAATGRTHPDLIPPIREAFIASGLSWVIENVPAAALRRDLVLCNEMFKTEGVSVIQHRVFECGGWTPPQPKHVRHRGYVRGWRHGVWRDGPYVQAYGKGGGKATVAEMQEAKGIDWTDDHFALREAIPPAYAEYAGRHLMAHLTGSAAAPLEALTAVPLFEEIPMSQPPTIPLGAPASWSRVVVDRAGSQCECTGGCGATHSRTQGRCPRRHGGWHNRRETRLILAPRRPLTPLAQAVALPDAELMAECEECLKGAEKLARAPRP